MLTTTLSEAALPAVELLPPLPYAVVHALHAASAFERGAALRRRLDRKLFVKFSSYLPTFLCLQRVPSSTIYYGIYLSILLVPR